MKTLARYSIGIDIGGTKCAVCLGRGEIGAHQDFLLDKSRFPTDSQEPDKTIQLIINEILKLLQANHVEISDIIGIGISCGSPLDPKRGIVLGPPNLPGWNHVPIVEKMENRFGVRAHLQNDANACALAEWRFGAARGASNAVFLTFGTGMGAGLILNGSLYCGAGNMAGEIGHIRLEKFGPVGYGKQGSLEGFCSGGGIAWLGKTMIQAWLQGRKETLLCPDGRIRDVTAEEIAEAARQGDPLAREIYRVSGEQLGRGLSILIDLLNPDVIVIGSIYQRCEDLLAPSMRETLKREALRESLEHVRILPSRLAESIGDYAALSLAFLQE